MNIYDLVQQCLVDLSANWQRKVRAWLGIHGNNLSSRLEAFHQTWLGSAVSLCLLARSMYNPNIVPMITNIAHYSSFHFLFHYSLCNLNRDRVWRDAKHGRFNTGDTKIRRALVSEAGCLATFSSATVCNHVQWRSRLYAIPKSERSRYARLTLEISHHRL